MPTTPFSGVRISWLIVARNSLFASEADSAISLASISSWARRVSASTRCCSRRSRQTAAKPRRLPGLRVVDEEEVDRDRQRLAGHEMPAAELALPAAGAEHGGHDRRRGNRGRSSGCTKSSRLTPSIGRERRDADEPAAGGIHEQHPALHARESDEVVGMLDDRREDAAIRLGALLLGEVADDADEHPLVAARHLAEGEAERKDAAVASPADHFAGVTAAPGDRACEPACDRAIVPAARAARQEARDARARAPRRTSTRTCAARRR